MCEVYKIFSHDWKDICDYSNDAIVELYNVDSYGGRCSKLNGYGLGKKWLSVTVAMWKQDIKTGHLFKSELYNDPKFPHWWLDSVLRDC